MRLRPALLLLCWDFRDARSTPYWSGRRRDLAPEAAACNSSRAASRSCVQAGAETRVLRNAAQPHVAVPSAEAYGPALQAAGITLCPQQRAEAIWRGVQAAAAEVRAREESRRLWCGGVHALSYRAQGPGASRTPAAWSSEGKGKDLAVSSSPIRVLFCSQSINHQSSINHLRLSHLAPGGRRHPRLGARRLA
jgi:hypothetical protein